MVVLFVIIILALVGQNFSSETEKQPIDVFLKQSGFWGGEFVN